MIETVDTISGQSFLAAQRALEITGLARPDIHHYTVAVVETEDSTLVLFICDKGKNAGLRDHAVRISDWTLLDKTEVPSIISMMDQLNRIDQICGTSFLAIETALGAVQKPEPALEHYQIQVLREGESLVVIILDKNRKPASRGNISVLPGYEVELDPVDLSVIRSNMIR